MDVTVTLASQAVLEGILDKRNQEEGSDFIIVEIAFLLQPEVHILVFSEFQSGDFKIAVDGGIDATALHWALIYGKKT